MKSVKKVLSLLLVGVVVTSSLVGCGIKKKTKHKQADV